MKKLITLITLTTLFLVSCTKFPVSTTLGTLNVSHDNNNTCLSDSVVVTLDSLSKEYTFSTKFTSITINLKDLSKVNAKASICVPDSVLGLK